MTDRPEMTMTRLIDAPKDLVFKIWTEPAHFPMFYCPSGFTTVLCEMDVRVGGAFRIHWADAEGKRYPNKGIYTRIEPTDLLAYQDSFDDDREANDPIDVIVSFEDENGKTRLTSRSIFASVEMLEMLKNMGMEQGWAMFMDQMRDYAQQLSLGAPMAGPELADRQVKTVPPAEPVIELKHVYDAPLALVWEAYTRPEHLVHWWGPNGFTIEHKSADIRLGGHWEFVMVGPDGTRFPNYQTFTEFTPMQAISHKHGATHADDPDTFDQRITFKDLGGKTEVTMRMSFGNMDARQAVLAFHADTLGLQTMGKLDAYLNRRKGA